LLAACPALGLAAGFLAAASMTMSIASRGFVGSPAVAPVRGGKAVMRAKRPDYTPRWTLPDPYHSSKERERILRRRKMIREEDKEFRKTGGTNPTLNYDKLPAIDDLYTRQFSGNANEDPVGGRPRYTFIMMFKHDPKSFGEDSLKAAILNYINFMKTKLSCKSITAKAMLSPIDGKAITQLEYPMRQYGAEFTTNKPVYNQAKMVQLDFVGPPAASEYLRNRMYADGNLLRFMMMKHTKSWNHVGEENELFL